MIQRTPDRVIHIGPVLPGSTSGLVTTAYRTTENVIDVVRLSTLTVDNTSASSTTAEFRVVLRDDTDSTKRIDHTAKIKLGADETATLPGRQFAFGNGTVIPPEHTLRVGTSGGGDVQFTAQMARHNIPDSESVQSILER